MQEPVDGPAVESGCEVPIAYMPPARYAGLFLRPNRDPDFAAGKLSGVYYT
jgi:hypothetical protein